MKNYKRSQKLAYLDIETSWKGTISVIGIYRSEIGTKQLVAPDMPPEILRKLLDDTSVIFTYNGSRFDLPVIKRFMGVDIESDFNHHDLMYDCWAQNLYGGLKKVERTLGIGRDTEGIDGIAAMNLWDRFIKYDDEESLEILLRYNKEDIENLEILALKLGVLK